jgi:hypothetical protein
MVMAQGRCGVPRGGSYKCGAILMGEATDAEARDARDPPSPTLRVVACLADARTRCGRSLKRGLELRRWSNLVTNCHRDVATDLNWLADGGRVQKSTNGPRRWRTPGPTKESHREANHHCSYRYLVIHGLFDQPSGARQHGNWAPRSSHKPVSRRHAAALRAAQGLNGNSRHD